MKREEILENLGHTIKLPTLYNSLTVNFTLTEMILFGIIMLVTILMFVLSIRYLLHEKLSLNKKLVIVMLSSMMTFITLLAIDNGYVTNQIEKNNEKLLKVDNSYWDKEVEIAILDYEEVDNENYVEALISWNKNIFTIYLPKEKVQNNTAKVPLLALDKNTPYIAVWK